MAATERIEINPKVMLGKVVDPVGCASWLS